MSQEKLTRVDCELRDCAFHHLDGDSRIFCRHAEKPHYMSEARCPLYRMDWSKKEVTTAQAQNFLSLVKRRK